MNYCVHIQCISVVRLCPSRLTICADATHMCVHARQAGSLNTHKGAYSHWEAESLLRWNRWRWTSDSGRHSFTFYNGSYKLCRLLNWKSNFSWKIIYHWHSIQVFVAPYKYTHSIFPYCHPSIKPHGPCYSSKSKKATTCPAKVFTNPLFRQTCWMS